MIIVLEGNRCSGKTTLALELSKYYNAKVVRPFRHESTHHHDSGSPLQEQLRALGVPVNTYVEDLYVADIVGGLSSERNHFILDRTIASAIVHDSYPADVTDPGALLRLWQSLLARGGRVYYVLLTAEYGTASRRVEARDFPLFPSFDEFRRFRTRHEMAYDLIASKKCWLETSHISTDAALSVLCTWINTQEISHE